MKKLLFALTLFGLTAFAAAPAAKADRDDDRRDGYYYHHHHDDDGERYYRHHDDDNGDRYDHHHSGYHEHPAYRYRRSYWRDGRRYYYESYSYTPGCESSAYAPGFSIHIGL